MKIGVVGVGAMGAPMARNLARDGDTVLAYDIVPDRARAVAGGGVEQAGSVAQVARGCELIVLMTPDDAALRDVMHGDGGVLSVGTFSGCIVDLSTTSEHLAREIGAAAAARGVGYLDGAVIGGSVAAARDGASPIVVSGDEALLERYRRVLERLGSVDHAGVQGNAKIVKICNNLLLGMHTVSGAEALSIAEAAGLALEDTVAWLDASSGNTAAMRAMFGRFSEHGAFPEGIASFGFFDKDMALGCALAERHGYPAFLAHLTRQLLATAARAEGVGAPFASVLSWYRAMGRAGAVVPAQREATAEGT